MTSRALAFPVMTADATKAVATLAGLALMLWAIAIWSATVAMFVGGFILAMTGITYRGKRTGTDGT